MGEIKIILTRGAEMGIIEEDLGPTAVVLGEKGHLWGVAGIWMARLGTLAQAEWGGNRKELMGGVEKWDLELVLQQSILAFHRWVCRGDRCRWQVVSL